MALKGNWNYPTTIRFGAGRIRELPQACAARVIVQPDAMRSTRSCRPSGVRRALA